MSPTLFESDIDIAGAEDLKSGPEEGNYPGTVTEVKGEIGSKNNPNRQFIVFTYILDGYSFPKIEKKWSPTKQELASVDGAGVAQSYLKARLKSLGVPLDRMNSVESEEIEGQRVIVTLKKNQNGYINVSLVALLDEDNPVTLPGSTAPVTNVAAVAATKATLDLSALGAVFGNQQK